MGYLMLSNSAILAHLTTKAKAEKKNDIQNRDCTFNG